MQSSRNHPTSILGDSLSRLADDPRGMLDPSTIVTLDALNLSTAVALRSELRTFSDVAIHPEYWVSFGVPPITNGIISSKANSVPSIVDNTCWSKLASWIESEVDWFFDDSISKPGGPTWKFARELENILLECQRILPQENRLSLILGTDLALEGKERLRDAVEMRSLGELETAKSLVFRAAVLKVAVEKLPGLNHSRYRRASVRKKAGALGGEFRLRLIELHDSLGRNSSQKIKFLEKVVGVWMHMIALNGKLSQGGYQDSSSFKYSEDPYAYVGYFADLLENRVPDVLRYLRGSSGH